MAITTINIASATGTNWLKEAQQSIADSASPGGLLGALQDATAANKGSIRAFLAKSQNNTNAFAQISQSSQSAAGALAAQMSAAANQKLQAERIALAQKMNPLQTNYNPPGPDLDPVIYFEDGGSIDTSSNIMTMARRQADRHHHGPGVSRAGLDHQSWPTAPISTPRTTSSRSADGTKIDTVTGLTITV